jgi:hypothetical protein
MYVCPQCTTTVDLKQLGHLRATCPDCGAPLREENVRPWTDVARVRNLAEAGFLSDELIGLGIDARIHQLEDYSAMGDRRTTLYLIRVPSRMASDAAAQIRQHLADDDPEGEPDGVAFRFSTHDEPADPLFWRPVAIVILAGVASFVLGQRFSEQKEHRVERRPPRDSLASAVEAIGRPLVTDPDAGQPRYRLSFDRRRQSWVLERDRDGDGVFDSRQAFHSSGAPW